MRDFHSNNKAVKTLATAVYTSDQNGAGVDRQGFESVEHLIQVGVSGDTLSGSKKIDFIIEESDDDATYTAVTSASDVLVDSAIAAVSAPDGSGIFLTIDDAAEDDVLARIGYVGGKRYSRVVADFTGTHSNGIPLAMLAVLGHAEQAPVSD